VHDIIESAKRDKKLMQAVGGVGFDINSMMAMLFDDKHFLHLLGDLLNKRPATKKVE